MDRPIKSKNTAIYYKHGELLKKVTCFSYRENLSKLLLTK